MLKIPALISLIFVGFYCMSFCKLSHEDKQIISVVIINFVVYLVKINAYGCFMNKGVFLYDFRPKRKKCQTHYLYNQLPPSFKPRAFLFLCFADKNYKKNKTRFLCRFVFFCLILVFELSAL